ncbi:hypothetical protein MPTA5024_27800 [Microbispora sp. ATCC PTA-5024]|nr:hypothetical protein MPTA5024_27800 [Microbispora sp. ATCC PTA-5024]
MLQQPRGRAGVLLAGRNGVGKTRLLEEAADAFARRASVVHLSPGWPEAGLDGAALADAAGAGAHRQPLPERRPRMVDLMRSLGQAGQGRKTVLVADDAHLLDPVSSELILEFARRKRGLLILAASTEADMPPALTRLWKDDHIARMDLAPLDTESTRRLASALLDDQLAYDGAVRLAEMSDGYPLVLRELMRGALELGTLSFENGRWILGDGVPVSLPLRELLGSKIDELSVAPHRALELVALAEPVPLAILESLISPADLVAIETRELIRVRPAEEGGRDRLHVHLAHPLIGHIVRHDLPVLRGRQYLGLLIEAYAGTRRTRREQARTVAWRLEIGETPTATELLETARYLYGVQDLKAAGRIAQTSWLHYESVEGGLLYAHILISQADFDGAFAVLGDLRETAGPRTEIDLSRVRAWILQGRLEEAELLLDGLGGARSDLYRAMIAYFKGDFLRTLDLTGELIRDERGESRAEAALFLMGALCHAGRPLDAIRVYEDVLAGRDDGCLVLHEGSAEEMYAGALQAAGRLEEAIAVLEAEYAAAVRNRQAGLDARRGLALGSALLDMGEARRALDYFTLTPAYQTGWEVWERKAQVFRLLARTCLAAPEIDDRDSSPIAAMAESNNSVLQAAAQARVAAMNCDHERAARLLTAAAESARASGGHGDVAVAVHEMARLGAATKAAPFWDAPVQGPFLAARLAYARALATRDPDLLQETADAFVAVGAKLFAAEAFAELSRLLRRSGKDRAATSAAGLAQALTAECGAATPALHAVDEVQPLTARERDIALLAARGLSDKEIAERLVLSMRTVGNHLHHVYKKLGVTSRRDLLTRMER